MEEGEVNKETACFELYLKMYFNMETGKLCMITQRVMELKLRLPVPDCCVNSYH